MNYPRATQSEAIFCQLSSAIFDGVNRSTTVNRTPMKQNCPTFQSSIWRSSGAGHLEVQRCYQMWHEVTINNSMKLVYVIRCIMMTSVIRDIEQYGVSKLIAHGRGTFGAKRKYPFFKRKYSLFINMFMNLNGNEKLSIHIKVATDLLASCCSTII